MSSHPAQTAYGHLQLHDYATGIAAALSLEASLVLVSTPPWLSVWLSVLFGFTLAVAPHAITELNVLTRRIWFGTFLIVGGGMVPIAMYSEMTSNAGKLNLMPWMAYILPTQMRTLLSVVPAAAMLLPTHAIGAFAGSWNDNFARFTTQGEQFTVGLLTVATVGIVLGTAGNVIGTAAALMTVVATVLSMRSRVSALATRRVLDVVQKSGNRRPEA